MKLNIQLISHPIIQSLAELIINDKKHVNAQDSIVKNLGLLIIYETIRSWIKIYKLKIKRIKLHEEIVSTDPKESYVIIINDLKYFNYFYEVKNLIPQINFQLIKEDEINEKNIAVSDCVKINQCTKIIIALRKLNAEYVSSLIDHLIKNKNIGSDKINLISIVCTKNQIIKLSQQHSYLSLYTSKIL